MDSVILWHSALVCVQLNDVVLSSLTGKKVNLQQNSQINYANHDLFKGILG